MLTKEKLNGDIKGKAYSDGRKKIYNMSEEIDLPSPTFKLEALFFTLLIDANKNRDVSTFDVPGAFLKPELLKSKDEVLL